MWFWDNENPEKNIWELYTWNNLCIIIRMLSLYIEWPRSTLTCLEDTFANSMMLLFQYIVLMIPFLGRKKIPWGGLICLYLLYWKDCIVQSLYLSLLEWYIYKNMLILNISGQKTFNLIWLIKYNNILES